MTVTLTISSTPGGSSIGDTVDLGSIAPEGSATAQDLYISHDGAFAITDCGLYLTQFVGTYGGDEDPAADLVEILGWGDGGEGVKINMDHTTPNWLYFSNTQGDIDAPIVLDKDCVTPAAPQDGTIPVGDEAHIQISLDIPGSGVTASTKAFGLVIAFSATS
jgi:hypothetical protein